MANRVVFDGLRGNEELSIEAPVRVEQTRYALGNLNRRARMGPDQYDLEFKNNVISIGEEAPDPGGRELIGYRTFRRDHLRAPKVPLEAMPA
jgi:hypothetical protein